MTDAVSLQKAGIYNTTGRIVQTHIQSTLGSAGQRTCLGFIAPNGATYIHIKTNLGGSVNQMHKFEYDGYTYSSINCHNSVTFYTYHGTSSPYDPSLVNFGETPGGIVNYYYSSDDYVVIVIQASPSYTGGFLYHQTGRSHINHAVDILAHTSSSNNSGVY